KLSTVQDWLREIINPSPTPPSLKQIRKVLERAARRVAANPAAESLTPEIAVILDKARRREAASKKGRRLSHTDLLCGLMLPKLFERQFATRATTARNGKYVKFALAYLETLGLNTEAETIIRSMSAVKKAYPKLVQLPASLFPSLPKEREKQPLKRA